MKVNHERKIMTKMPKGKLPDRPKPPTLEEIHSDIEAANDDDVVFCEDKEEIPLNKSVAMEESFLDISPDGNDTDAEQSDTKETNEKEKVYQQTLKMIEVHQKLQDAPQMLQEQFEHLQQLEEDVTKSISELKEASESFSLKR